MNELLFGAAYYDEYMPCDRLEKDAAMMKKAGINTVRIAESTWSTCEPQEGVFDFSHVERVLDVMEENGIHVIIGTPTYAVPTWLVKSHPDVLATTVKGRGIYGPRQIMDITNPAYRYYGERVIRELMKRTAHRTCVIGFQLDNETKYYGTAGKNVQERFVKYLRSKFHDGLDVMNHEFGLDYWSNRINAWEDFPDVRETINGSLGAEFEKFQRTLVDEFLSWQANIVNEYRREDQFITHNFDFEWRGYSFGVQPDVNHYHASRALTIAGGDIYHPTQDELTGTESAFANEHVKVSHEIQPHILKDCLGVQYHQFTFPKNVTLSGSLTEGLEQTNAETFMELLISNEAETLLSYEHYNWKGYAAVTRNHYGKGTGTYLGCMMEKELLKKILLEVLHTAKAEVLEEHFPVIVRKGINDFGKTVRFYFNYSPEKQSVRYSFADGVNMLCKEEIRHSDMVVIDPWDVVIIEEKAH